MRSLGGSEKRTRPDKTRKGREIGFLTTLSMPCEGSAGLTGGWRVFRPVMDEGKCNKCLLCWIYCPEACISKEIEIDYNFCKGCGVCAEECPRRAIDMAKEDKA